jgi:hypothetical protein
MLALFLLPHLTDFQRLECQIQVLSERGGNRFAMAAPELLQWCLAGGVSWNGVEAGYVAEGWRGVLATQDIPPGERPACRRCRCVAAAFGFAEQGEQVPVFVGRSMQ